MNGALSMDGEKVILYYTLSAECIMCGQITIHR